MKYVRLILAALALCWCVQTAFSYSAPGHQAIGKLAGDLIQNDEETAKQVSALLGNTNLDDVAVWADWIRLKEFQHITGAEYKDIEQRFPLSDNWHFANLPLGTQTYGVDYPADDQKGDVVIGINTCIKILETPDTSPNHDAHQIALKFLVHLIGDIHQPLHVGCAYYQLGPGSKVKIVTDPQAVLQNHLPHDRGGNKLMITSSQNVHHFWDDYLVQHLDPSRTLKDYHDVADYLSQQTIDESDWKVDGDYHAWAAAWATDSAHIAAASVYKGFSVTTAELDTRPHHDGEIAQTQITGFNKATYVKNNRTVEETQMLKAAYRLADLLRHINWAD